MNDAHDDNDAPDMDADTVVAAVNGAGSRGGVDLVIIGAGPAGLAAAGTAASLGLTVTLLDEQPAAGGQIYRRVGQVPAARRALLGKDYADGDRLLRALDEPNVSHVAGATVWQVEPGITVSYSVGGRAAQIDARHLVIATGALERPMPFPGWTLPGVMTAGAAQILMKGAGVIPDEPVVLAGSGPLLYLLAWQYLRAGVRPAALVETVPAGNQRRAMAHAPGALTGFDYLFKGARMLHDIVRAGIPRYSRAQALRAEGTDRLSRLRFTSGGLEHAIDCDLLAIHQGVVPNTQLSRSLFLQHEFDPTQRCWRPTVDEWGVSSSPEVSIAGDGAGIGGAVLAAFSGEVAALGVAERLGALDGATARQRARTGRGAMRRQRAVRGFLDTLYAPDPQFLAPPDDTVVCRCEEVSAGDLRRFVALGCLGPNQAKSFGRSGMGPCQGRMCGITVSEVIAAARGVPVSEVEALRIRPPIKPVTLGELASLDQNDELAAAGRAL